MSRPTRLTPCLYRLTSSLATLALLIIPPALLCSAPGCTPDGSPVIPRPPAGPTVILGPAVPEGVRIEARGLAGPGAEATLPPVVLEPAGDPGAGSPDSDLIVSGTSPASIDAKLRAQEGQIAELFVRVRMLEGRAKP